MNGMFSMIVDSGGGVGVGRRGGSLVVEKVFQASRDDIP